jgi:hypothetical protein
MTDLPDVSVQITRYEVSLLPEGDINRKYFTLFVEHWGKGVWGVHDGAASYDIDGDRSDGLKPYGREGWEALNRFDLDTALAVAKEAAPHVVVNGHTATDAYYRTHPEEPTR